MSSDDTVSVEIAALASVEPDAANIRDLGGGAGWLGIACCCVSGTEFPVMNGETRRGGQTGESDEFAAIRTDAKL